MIGWKGRGKRWIRFRSRSRDRGERCSAAVDSRITDDLRYSPVDALHHVWDGGDYR